MDERSQETLHRVEQNDATLTTLMIGTILTRANGGEEEEVGAFMVVTFRNLVHSSDRIRI